MIRVIILNEIEDHQILELNGLVNYLGYRTAGPGNREYRNSDVFVIASQASSEGSRTLWGQWRLVLQLGTAVSVSLPLQKEWWN